MVFPMSALLTGVRSTKPLLKLGSDRCHEIQGIGAIEAAVHSLALLQAGICDAHGTHHGLPAIGRIGAEIDHDRRPRCACLALHVDRRQRQRAGKTADVTVDKQAADVVLRQQGIYHLARTRGVLVRNINQI